MPAPDPEPARDWSAWALLLIDVQKDFWTREHQQAFPELPDNIRELLDFCRRQGIEVVHVRSRFRADSSDWMLPYRLFERIPCVEDTGGDQVLPFAAEAAGERVFVKQTFDAFHVPELAPYLHNRGKRLVLTAGLETSYCVLFTSAAACQHGFLTLMVEDCCADDPDFDPKITHELLERYRGKVFWRIPRSAITTTRRQWIAKLDRLAQAPTR